MDFWCTNNRWRMTWNFKVVGISKIYFLIFPHEKRKSLRVFIHLYSNEIFRKRKEMELKCLYFAICCCWHVLDSLAVEMFDVNSCHAFLIRNVIRCDWDDDSSTSWDLPTTLILACLLKKSFLHAKLSSLYFSKCLKKIPTQKSSLKNSNTHAKGNNVANKLKFHFN